MTTLTTIDLAAYLTRIGHVAPVSPTLETLRALVVRHAATIPFENLDPLMGRTPDLSPAGLERKLLKAGRGGYCFEHNLLLKHVLEAIGFSVTGLAGRVLWNQPEGAITPRSHMLLQVDLPEGPHMVDVGFGGMTLTGVLRLDTDQAQETPHGPFRLVTADGYRHLQALVRDVWATIYRFEPSPQYPIDYEVTNYYLANAPSSHFRHGLLAARVGEDARYGLRNNKLSIHRHGGESETRTIESVAELREVLEQQFRVALPDDPALDPALARVLMA